MKKNIFISNFLTSEEREKFNIDAMIIDRNNFLNQFFISKIINHTWLDKDYIKFINPLIKNTKMINDELEKYKIAFSSVPYTDEELKAIFEEEIKNAKNIWIEKKTFERLQKLYPNIQEILEKNDFQIVHWKDTEKKLEISHNELSEIIGWYIAIISRIYLKDNAAKNKNYIKTKKRSGKVQMLFDLADQDQIQKNWKRVQYFMGGLRNLKAYKKMQNKGISNHLFFKLEDLIKIYEKNFIKKEEIKNKEKI